MPEKLLNLAELAEYLKLSEEEIRKLVEDGVIPSYRIGGSFLRFRKEQVDAIKEEIFSKRPHLIPKYRVKLNVGEETARIESTETVTEKVLDFLYFSDFYIISSLLIILMLYIIFKM